MRGRYLFVTIPAAVADLVEQKASELFKAAQQAHHAYEQDELQGKRDEQWPAWFADYLVTNGLGDLVGKELDLDELAAFLEESSRQFEQSSKQVAWHGFTAKRFFDDFE